MNNTPATIQRITYKELEGLVHRIFLNAGCSDAVATILARNCASAQRDGAHSHGIFRLPGYIESLKSGWVDGRATPLIEDVSPGLLRINAANGFAQVALEAGRQQLIEKARHSGIALMAIRNSHHFAALSFDVEPFAEAGFVALSVLNSVSCVVPHGAKKAVFGTNPIAFAAPCASGNPIVFDMATSVMAKGDVRIAAREGHTLPIGVGVDRDGQDTTDPQAILDDGALHPFGGHKGSALAMMIEILCAALVGSDFSFEVDLSAYPGAHTPRTGQTLILINPDLGMGGLPQLPLRVDLLVDVMRASGQTRLPGDRKGILRRKAATTGIEISDTDLQKLRTMATHVA